MAAKDIRIAQSAQKARTASQASLAILWNQAATLNWSPRRTDIKSLQMKIEK